MTQSAQDFDRLHAEHEDQRLNRYLDGEEQPDESHLDDGYEDYRDRQEG